MPAHVTARLRKWPSCTAVMNAAMRRNARSGGSFGRAWWQHFRRESIRNAHKCCGATRRAAVQPVAPARAAVCTLRVALQSLRAHIVLHGTTWGGAPRLRRAGTHGPSPLQRAPPHTLLQSEYTRMRTRWAHSSARSYQRRLLRWLGTSEAVHATRMANAAALQRCCGPCRTSHAALHCR